MSGVLSALCFWSQSTKCFFTSHWVAWRWILHLFIYEKSLQACCSSVVLCVIPQGSSWRSTLYTLIESKGHPETNTWLWVISQWDARKNKFTHNYNSCDPTHLSDVNINKITIRPTVTWPADKLPAHIKPNHISVVSTLLYCKYSTAFL